MNQLPVSARRAFWLVQGLFNPSPQHPILCTKMPSSERVFSTPLTRLFNINHPIMLAGMNVAAGPKLAATVTNSGGIGVIGGVRQTPKILKQSIEELKSYLEDKSAPFGVDLLLPQVGGNARKTNASLFRGILRYGALTCFRSMIIPTVSLTSSLTSSSIARQPYSSAQSEYLPRLLWINCMQPVYL